MSLSSSLLAGGVGVVGLYLAWSLLPADCSNSMIVNLVSDVLSLCGSGLCIRDMQWRRRLRMLAYCG